MTGFNMTAEAVPVPGGVGTEVAVEVGPLHLFVLLLVDTPLRLLWYLQARLTVLNCHFYEIQEIRTGGRRPLNVRG